MLMQQSRKCIRDILKGVNSESSDGNSNKASFNLQSCEISTEK